MKIRSKLLIVLLVGTASLFVAAGIYAATKVPDVIEMNNKAYKKHKKKIVFFSHKKHIDKYNLSCGECHHDEKGKPLAKIEAGEDVKGCIVCHKKPGERPKGKKAPKLNKKQRLEYHAEAMHYNCKGCHKAFKKKNKSKKAPTSCKKCHAKK